MCVCVRVCVCVRACVRERERERGGGGRDVHFNSEAYINSMIFLSLFVLVLNVGFLSLCIIRYSTKIVPPEFQSLLMAFSIVLIYPVCFTYLLDFLNK